MKRILQAAILLALAAIIPGALFAANPLFRITGTTTPGHIVILGPTPFTGQDGGVPTSNSIAPVSHKWINSIVAGAGVLSQPAFSDISGTASAAQIPLPTASSIGGIESIVNAAHNWISYIDTSGVPHQAQPAFTDISGTASAAQIPAATNSTIGGVESFAAVSHEWLASIATGTGVPTLGQPACGDLSDEGVFCNGTNSANLTGALPAAVLSTGTALTGQTVENTINATNDSIWYYSAADGALRKTSVGNFTSTGVSGVASFNTRIGAVLPASGDYTVAQVTGAAPLASPALTGAPLAPTPGTNINTTQIPTTAWVNSYYAALASPTFTGAPLAPTPGTNINTTQIPTTAWVNTYYDTLVHAGATWAPLASPALTGTPTAPTAGSNINTTQLATTAWVNSYFDTLVHAGATWAPITTTLTASAPTAHGVLLGEGTQAAGVTGAGIASYVLTSNGASADPTFQAPPSSGPVLLATLTASSSPSLSDTTHITSAYNSYTFIFRALLLSSSTRLETLYSINNGTSYLSTGYVQSCQNSTATYIVGCDLMQQVTAVSAGPYSGQLNFSNPNSTVGSGAILSGVLGMNGGFTHGPAAFDDSNTTTSTINGIEWLPLTGTITSGSIEIWGNP